MNDLQKKSHLWAAGAMALTAAGALQPAGGPARGLGKRSRVVGTSEILPEDTPRNAACPCGSGKKYKRCCGK